MRIVSLVPGLVLATMLLGDPSGARADVLISELCDPRLDYLTDRYVEIYNSGASAVDLTGWSIVAVGNGGDVFTWNLSGSIASGQAKVAADQTTVVSFPVDFPSEAWSDNNSLWNGKVGDGARLLNGGALVDYAVVDATLFENKTYVRNAGVSASATFIASQWVGTAVDLPTDATPGTHAGGSPGTGPSVTSVASDPAAPSSTDVVDIMANVSDAVANITLVVAKWGFSAGSLPNQILMTLDSGTTYRTTSTIPAQAPGTEIFFQVDATNDVAQTTQSVELSYQVGSLGPPAGYYASAEGLSGTPLRQALHNIIDSHSSVSYSFLWTAFQTTDDKPNGKVWDIYSDVPGGTPPYEYTFGADQGGTGGVEGTGYNREHTWPRSWFGGEVLPMNTDIFMVYPTDNYINNVRANYPFGEISSPTFTSLNGSMVGPCTYPGYSGTVFEPIDEYKGDLARSYFYMTTRYYTEDAGWPGSPMTSGADLLSWGIDMLLDWHFADPVSTKELERNAAIYDIQQNRNPYIDRPEFAALLFGITTDAPRAAPVPFVLGQNYPNPFNPITTIAYDLDQSAALSLKVYDTAGRLVRTLDQGMQPAGPAQVIWSGVDDQGRSVASGVYFYRLSSQGLQETRRMTLVR